MADDETSEVPDGDGAGAEESPEEGPSGWSRRRFLKVAAGLGVAGVVGTGRLGFYPDEAEVEGLENLSVGQGAVLYGLLETMLPPGADRSPERLRDHVRFMDDYLTGLDAGDVAQLGWLLRGIEHATLPFGPHLVRFTRLGPEERRAYLEGWQKSSIGLRRLGYRSLKTFVFLSCYRSPDAWRSIGYGGPVLPEPPERPFYERLVAPPDARPGWPEEPPPPAGEPGEDGPG